LNFRTRRSWDN